MVSKLLLDANWDALLELVPEKDRTKAKDLLRKIYAAAREEAAESERRFPHREDMGR